MAYLLLCVFCARFLGRRLFDQLERLLLDRRSCRLAHTATARRIVVIARDDIGTCAVVVVVVVAAAHVVQVSS